MHDIEINSFTEGLKLAKDEFYIDAIDVFNKLINVLMLKKHALIKRVDVKEDIFFCRFIYIFDREFCKT